MLLLETANRILEEAILARLNSADKKEPVDITFADFDGVQFHVSTDANNRSLVNVSMQVKGAKSLLEDGGGQAFLKQTYGNLLQSQPEQSYDVTLQIDLEANNGNSEEFAKKISLVKRHLFAAPFLKAFDMVEKKTVNPGDVISIPYRPEEAVYIKPQAESVMVIFDILFRDADDVILSKVFLQEFSDARRTISNAPAVSFSQKEPPLDLKGVKGVKVGDNQGFVTFVLFAGHIAGKKKEFTADSIITFRDYLHYHIKCSKAYMHTRMRLRVESLLQILNRARPEPVEVVKKTAQGKTFKRAGKE